MSLKKFILFLTITLFSFHIIRQKFLMVVKISNQLKREAPVFTGASPKGARKMIRNLS